MEMTRAFDLHVKKSPDDPVLLVLVDYTRVKQSHRVVFLSVCVRFVCKLRGDLEKFVWSRPRALTPVTVQYSYYSDLPRNSEVVP